MNLDVPDSLQVVVERIVSTSSSHGERLASLAEQIHALGVREVPPRSNDGPWIRRFLRGDAFLPWCAAFLLWCLMVLAAPLPSIGYWRGRSVDAWWRSAKKDGTAFGHWIRPRRGDLLFWRRRGKSDAGRGRHIDVIVDVRHEDGRTRLTVIGGNVNDRVSKYGVWHGDSAILGYGRVGAER